MFRCNRFLMEVLNQLSKIQPPLLNYSNLCSLIFLKSSLVKAAPKQILNHSATQMILKKLVSSIIDLLQFRVLQLQITTAASPNVVWVSTSTDSGWDPEVPTVKVCEICCVCLSRLKVGGGRATTILPCLHKFHETCIDRWFDTGHRTCPVCRTLLEDAEMSWKREAELTEEMATWFSSFHVAGL